MFTENDVIRSTTITNANVDLVLFSKANGFSRLRQLELRRTKGRDHVAPGVAVVAFLWPVAVCVVVGNLFADLHRNPTL